MTDTTDSPSDDQPEAGGRQKTVNGNTREVWTRGLWMLVLLLLFSIAQALLWATAILQFGWLLFTGRKNPHITDFGTKLGNWMAITARYQAVAGEEKPFPWSEWK
ncbi:DUF4389 domain-containing protein [Rhodovulum sp. ES.010]|uniref:DUF4389 domain-containing protein n=1 Tax=Rhodovulum sp. ES.010 TaxID=1882821 RepID=UPI0015881B8C|nr:DUF4389 domain-containing protein [Rhodovulum sp. ES.010]